MVVEAKIKRGAVSKLAKALKATHLLAAFEFGQLLER